MDRVKGEFDFIFPPWMNWLYIMVSLVWTEMNENLRTERRKKNILLVVFNGIININKNIKRDLYREPKLCIPNGRKEQNT